MVNDSMLLYYELNRRSWGLRSCRSGADYTCYGALNHMARSSVPTSSTTSSVCLFADPAMEDQEPIIDCVRIGNQALHPALRGLDDGMSPYYSFVICKSGNVGVYWLQRMRASPTCPSPMKRHERSSRRRRRS